MRDIFARYNLRNQEVYRRMMQFLLTNNGKEMSFNNLKKVFEIGSASTVMDFLQYLTDAYLFFLVPMYHTSLKVQTRNPRKVYGIDQGLVFSTSSSGSPDLGRLLETTVFLHLKRIWAEVWYFRGKKECDFITRSGKSDYEAFQVCLEVNEHNQQREFSGMLEAMEALKLQNGTIVTMNQEDTVFIDGKTIHLIPGWKWLPSGQPV
jgi:predicted AAA+ superfamily ATPase